MLGATIQTYRNAYSGLSRSTWLLSLIMLINRSGTMVVPFMTLYLTSPKMGYSVSQAGFVFGIFGLGSFTGAYLGGKLTDKIGFYPVQLITLICGGALFFVLGEMRSFPLVCLFTYLLSFVNEAFRPANSTAIAFYSKIENRTRSYALNRLAINIGWAVGSATGGLLAKINYELLFWVDGATSIAAGILLLFLLKPINHKTLQETEGAIPKSKSAFSDKTYIVFVIFTAIFACCFFQLFTNLPVFFKKDLHFSEPLIGFLLAINGVIIAIFEMVLVYKLEGKGKNLSYIMIGVLMVGLFFLLLTIEGVGPLLAFLLLVLVTMGEILCFPFLNTYWINRSQDQNRGQYAGLYTMAWSAAQTLGPMGGANIADKFGFRTLWLIAGAICLLMSFCYNKLRKYP